MKKTFSRLALVAVLTIIACVITGCSSVEGTFERTKKQSNLSLTYTLTFSGDYVCYDFHYQDTNTGEYGSGESKYGTYVTETEGNNMMVYITWDDGDHDTFVYNETSGSLSHTVEDWMVYYKEKPSFGN